MFYKHRRCCPPFQLQREGASTTRVAATATFPSPMFTKPMRNSFFHFLHNLIFIKKKEFVHHLRYQILASISWLQNPSCHILASRSWLPDPIYLELPGAIWSYPELSGATWGYLELSGSVWSWSYLELSGTIWS